MKLISQAIVKAQSQFKPVNKDSVNPFFHSNYADLSSILQSVLPVLNDCELALIQPIKVIEDKNILVTRLIHSSGEFIESEIILPIHADPQKLGSLITYYKRYQLQALLGISTREDDDDANSVTSNQPRQQQLPPDKKTVNDLASPAQVSLVKRLCGENINVTGLTKQQASKLIEDANKNRK
jgi:hypothetical protein